MTGTCLARGVNGRKTNMITSAVVAVQVCLSVILTASVLLPPLRRPTRSVGRKLGMSALRPYLAVAMILVIVKIIELAVGH